MASLFSQMFTRDNGRCVYCGRDLLKTFDDFYSAEHDHLIPLEKGGTDTINNLVTSCNVCNRLKGKYLPDGVLPNFINDPVKRTELIDELRDYIFSKRSEKIRSEYYSWFSTLSIY